MLINVMSAAQAILELSTQAEGLITDEADQNLDSNRGWRLRPRTN
jgi:hypothetical protein